MLRWLPLVALTCCVPQPQPPLKPVASAVRFDPPYVYHRWWAEMEQCSGRKGNIDLWTWWVYDGEDLGVTSDSTHAAARAYELPQRVVFSRYTFLRERTVKHEMLHALGVWQHDYRVFVTACGVESDRSIRWQDNPVNVPS